MSVLIIRKHRRYAVVRKAQVRHPDGGTLDALLIEASLEGCRIGNIESSRFAVGDRCRITIDGFGDMEGEVRWTGESRIGLHLTRALHAYELESLLNLCRGTDGMAARA